MRLMGDRIADTFLRHGAPMALDLFDEEARAALLEAAADEVAPVATARRTFDAAQVQL